MAAYYLRLKALKKRRKTIIVYVVLLFEILGILSAMHAVMNVRTPQGAIAWAVSLVTIPVVTVPAYWVFGRNKFQGYVLARRADADLLDEMSRRAVSQFERIEAQTEWGDTAIRGTERLARLPFTGNNEVELLIDGEVTFDSIFAGIDAAEEYVLVQFYIVRADDIGTQLQQHLISAAGRGVQVNFLYDEIGSLGLPRSYLAELRSAGVNVLPFHSRKGSGNRFQLNFRNHRKTVIVDGHTAWIGGHNVGNEYLGRDESFGHWRDTHMRLEGPAVLGAQIAFVEDWRWAADETLSDLNWEAVAVPDGPAQALVIASGPADEVETASLMFTQAINAATRRIWIASPYFVPDDAIVQSLQLAALRGVDVRILIPEVSDNRLVKLAAYSYFDEVKSTGVKFYRYQDGFLHQKAILLDDMVSTVGTANFDNRSFRLNFEITVVVVDSDFAQDVEQMFEADFANSRLMQPGEYDAKSYLFKVAVRLARLAAPVL
jgi:cardiolipin synthase